jgi:sulfate transport system substrate-binding protein
MKQVKITAAAFGLFALSAIAPLSAQDAPEPITLTLAGYAVPREAYGDIIPLFQQYWLAETGQQVNVLESYQASGAQSRAVAGGFAADVVALSIEPDITRLVDAGLVSEDWKEDNDYQGFVTQSLVVLAVRADNPKNIQDWADLAAEGVEVITPDPATSGGAQWNILAAAGAAERGFVPGFEGDTAVTDFLTALAGNVLVFDRDGRESYLTFERGIGDVAITYENEVIGAALAGGADAYVYPASTILIENPVAVVDTYVDQNGTREVAEAFVQFLWTPDAQRAFANRGFRPVTPEVRAQYGLAEEGVDIPEAADGAVAVNEDIVYPAVEDEFTIAHFGGWPDARAAYFGDNGLFTAIVAEVQG